MASVVEESFFVSIECEAPHIKIAGSRMMKTFHLAPQPNWVVKRTLTLGVEAVEKPQGLFKSVAVHAIWRN